MRRRQRQRQQQQQNRGGVANLEVVVVEVGVGEIVAKHGVARVNDVAKVGAGEENVVIDAKVRLAAALHLRHCQLALGVCARVCECVDVQGDVM